MPTLVRVFRRSWSAAGSLVFDWGSSEVREVEVRLSFAHVHCLADERPETLHAPGPFFIPFAITARRWGRELE